LKSEYRIVMVFHIHFTFSYC